MKVLTEAELAKIDANYEMLDLLYGSLRQFTALQRKATLAGNLSGMSLCDAQIRLLTIASNHCWHEIAHLVADPVPQPDPDPLEQAPAKEVIQ